MSFLFSEAQAQTATQAVPGTGPAPQSSLEMMLPILFMAALFYFLLIRPQQKNARTHKDMVGGVKRGDRIVTGGGVYGTVTRVESDDVLEVEIASGVTVQVARGTLLSVVADDPAADSKSKPRKGSRIENAKVANDN